MLPELFRIGSFPVRSYGVLLMIGVIIALFWARRRAPQRGIEPEKLSDMLFWILIPGILGARIVYMATHWSQFAGKPDQIFAIQFNGLTSFGGLIFGFLGFLVWAKRAKQPLWPLLDTLGAPVLVASAVGRIGCLLNGCCHGWPGSEWYCVHVADLGGKFAAAQLIDTTLCLVFAGIITLIEQKKKLAAGTSFALAVAGYGVSRFIFEFWRVDKRNELGQWVMDPLFGLPITKAQGMSLVFLIISVSLVLFAQRRKEAAE